MTGAPVLRAENKRMLIKVDTNGGEQGTIL